MIGNWAPLRVDRVGDVFGGAPFRWWIGGGVALELFAGRQWRAHADLDIGVVRAEGSRVYSWLSPDWDLWVAARGMIRPWDGESLDARSHENNVWARNSTSVPWRFDITVGSGNDTHWIYRRDESVKRAWDEAVRWAPAGVPYLAPEIQLLFKSKNPRPRDDIDAEVVIPLLDESGRAFLDANLDSNHPWRERL